MSEQQNGLGQTKERRQAKERRKVEPQHLRGGTPGPGHSQQEESHGLQEESEVLKPVGDRHQKPRRGHRNAQLAAWGNALVNVLLTFGKGFVGYATGSQALIADAVHSAADVVGSVAVLIGLRIARKPPDEDHPYGHGRAELISSAVVAIALILAAIQVLYESVRALFEAPGTPEAAAAWAAGISVVVKEVLYRYNFCLGQRLHSKGLLAAARDHRSDVYSSGAALIGILLSLIGKWTSHQWLLYMDPVAGGMVAVLILKMGYDISRESTQTLLDGVLEGGDIAPYESVIEQVAGVEHIDSLNVRDHGHYVIIDVKISVNAKMTVLEGHGIAAQVKKELKESQPRVQDVFVHVNPYFEDEGMSQQGTTKEEIHD